MEAAIVSILIFLGVIAISALLFAVWLVWEVLRLTCMLTWRIFFGRRPKPAAIDARPADVMVCPNPRCRGENPPIARFCRRCGSEMPRPQQVLARRAAMW